MSEVDYNTLTGIPVASQQFANAIIGPFIASWAFALMFYGFVFCTYLNYLGTTMYKQDARRLKAFLHFIMFLCTLQTAFQYWLLYHYATWQIRDANTFFSQTVIDCFLTTCVGFEGALVQIFLARRASALFISRIARAIYMAVIGLGVTAGLLGAMMYLALSFMSRAGTVNNALPLNFSIATGLWLYSCAFVDVVITCSLCILLKGRIVGFNVGTDSMLRKMVRLALETASYTAFLAAVGSLMSLAYITRPDDLNSNVSGAFWQPLAASYALSLVTTLNSREALRAARLEASGLAVIGNSTHIDMTTASHLNNINNNNNNNIYYKESDTGGLNENTGNVMSMTQSTVTNNNNNNNDNNNGNNNNRNTHQTSKVMFGIKGRSPTDSSSLSSSQLQKEEDIGF